MPARTQRESGVSRQRLSLLSNEDKTRGDRRGHVRHWRILPAPLLARKVSPQCTGEVDRCHRNGPPVPTSVTRVWRARRDGRIVLGTS